MQKIFSFLIIFFLLSACQQRKKDTKEIGYSKMQLVERLIKETQESFIPDKRDHIFDIQVKANEDKVILIGSTDYMKAHHHLKNMLINHKIVFADSIRQLPIIEFFEKIGITRLSVANLRAKPKHASELVTQTLMGTPLRILQKENGFYQVQTPEGYYAWVDAAGIVLKSKNEFEKWLAKPKVIVTNMCGMIYSEKKSILYPISDYVLNDVFAIKKVEKIYTIIEYPDGRTGIIDNKDISDIQLLNKSIFTKNLPEKIAETAKHYMGIPYLWGGTSAKGLDCSGFTKNVYAQYGYLLPRDASQQVKIGKKIEITDSFAHLQAGDLLFFGRMQNGKEKITHVAIHLGNGKIIHETGEVKIESLNPKDSNYNKNRHNSLMQARRIIGNYPQTFIGGYTN